MEQHVGASSKVKIKNLNVFHKYTSASCVGCGEDMSEKRYHCNQIFTHSRDPTILFCMEDNLVSLHLTENSCDQALTVVNRHHDRRTAGIESWDTKNLILLAKQGKPCDAKL